MDTGLAATEPGIGEGVDAIPSDPLCEALGYATQGCCSGTQLVYCEEGHILTQGCADSCGWNVGLNGYDCEAPATGDPSGLFPISCEAAGFPEIYWTPAEDEELADAPETEDGEAYEDGNIPAQEEEEAEENEFVGGTYAIEPEEEEAPAEPQEEIGFEDAETAVPESAKEEIAESSPEGFAVPRAAENTGPANPLPQ